ncbi:MAG: T9SS type A sorting domain-containing protein [Ignavibacteria bacterium]|nr:T9SS type A sorting domain-containing protein [Ignavibacteria bacterium]
MKTLILLAFFSSQIFSHMLFVNDLNYSPDENTKSNYSGSTDEMISSNSKSILTSGLTSAGFSNTVIRNTALEQTSSSIPGGYYLGQKVPDAFDPVTSFYFSLPKNQLVRIVILDMLGQSVKVLINDVVNTGTYKLNIDASGLSSGVYVYSFESENFTDSRKLLLVK